jgi:hypothetical protein
VKNLTRGLAKTVSPRGTMPGHEIHIHFVLSLRMRGAIPSLAHAYSWHVVWFSKKTTLPLNVEPSGSHPKRGKALDVNWEPALQIAIDCLGSQTPNP